IQSETVGNPAGTTTALTPSSVSYMDRAVVNCRDYYYNIKATDTTSCSNVSAALGTPLLGKAISTVAPAAPANVGAARVGATDALITWTGVNTDTSTTPVPIMIDKYNLWRCQIPTGQDPETATYTAVPGSPVTCTTTSCSVTDNSAPTDQGGK